jgi:hypothetical protein
VLEAPEARPAIVGGGEWSWKMLRELSFVELLNVSGGEPGDSLDRGYGSDGSQDRAIKDFGGGYCEGGYYGAGGGWYGDSCVTCPGNSAEADSDGGSDFG